MTWADLGPKCSGMAALAIDTHLFVKRLTAVGFSEPQAEAVTAVVREAREAELLETATKGDVALATETLRKEIEVVRKEIEVVRKEISEVKADLLKWVIGAIGFQTFVILGGFFAAIRLLNTP